MGAVKGCINRLGWIRYTKPLVPKLRITLAADLEGKRGEVTAVSNLVNVQVAESKRIDPGHFLLISNGSEVQPQVIQCDLDMLEVTAEALTGCRLPHSSVQMRVSRSSTPSVSGEDGKQF